MPSLLKYNSDKKVREKDRVKINIQDSTEDYMTGYQSSPMTGRERALDDLKKKRKRPGRIYGIGSKSTRNLINSARLPVVTSGSLRRSRKSSKGWYQQKFGLNHGIYTPRNGDGSQTRRSLADFERTHQR